jgi:hypothetical protein
MKHDTSVLLILESPMNYWQFKTLVMLTKSLKGVGLSYTRLGKQVRDIWGIPDSTRLVVWRGGFKAIEFYGGRLEVADMHRFILE